MNIIFNFNFHFNMDDLIEDLTQYDYPHWAGGMSDSDSDYNAALVSKNYDKGIYETRELSTGKIFWITKKRREWAIGIMQKKYPKLTLLAASSDSFSKSIDEFHSKFLQICCFGKIKYKYKKPVETGSSYDRATSEITLSVRNVQNVKFVSKK